MGYMSALAMKEQEISLRMQLEWHLTGNHYPPIPCEMIEPAIKAIELCNQGDFDGEIETPFPHVDYGTLVPARVIANNLHLHAWID